MQTKKLVLAILDGMAFFVFALGLILFAISYFSTSKDKEKRLSMEPCTQAATATVIHRNVYNEKVEDEFGYTQPGKDVYSVSYTYVVDGQEYKGSLDSYDELDIGDAIEIMYNPSDPTVCYTKEEMEHIPSGELTRDIFFYPGIVLAGLSVLAAIPLAIMKISIRRKEEKEREEAYRQAVERHNAQRPNVER